ncbi:GNAT family N-acetyltransferase [Paenibacillus sp. NFR01]|uniref:GNAT family N-acetyltransferase n=1 Tax=Paenibacillus sp. NFR01 TaxID=1566279 RepID=UPI0008BC969E|nr:GNAT family N-acetyltransferase [Paenibacillus sp. NFR01]SET40434.1 Acetyltransferase (GNAT) family protein [Paenibacillus sp. NFR01]
MITSYTITEFTPDDLQGADRVFEAAITDAFIQEGISELVADCRQEIAAKSALARQALEAEANVFFLVAKVEGQVAGTISFGPCGQEIREITGHALDEVGELGSLYILPEHQGQGIGSGLIRAMADALHTRGIGRFCLDSGYKRAQKRWLRKFGTPYTIAEDFWGPESPHMIWLCYVADYASANRQCD